MPPLSTARFVLRRLADDWKLLLSIFAGITVATTLIVGTPVYLRTLERQGINTAIDRSSNFVLNIMAFAPFVPLNQEELDEADQVVVHAIDTTVSDIYRGHVRYIKGPTYLVALPQGAMPASAGPPTVGQRLPAGFNRHNITGLEGFIELPDDVSPFIQEFVDNFWNYPFASQARFPTQAAPTQTQGRVSLGYLQYLSDLSDHVTFLAGGRMAGDQVFSSPDGPVVEVVVGTALAELFELRLGDLLTLKPSVDEPKAMFALLVGILEPIDRTEEYWQQNSRGFIEPEPLDFVENPELVDPEDPPLAMFASERAIAQGLGERYPGALGNSSWFIFVDKERLKGWSPSRSHQRIQAFETDLGNVLPGSGIFTRIERLLDDFDKRSFFSTVPLLLLLTIMIVTVLYYLGMMVSYLVQSREGDVALLKSRGVGTLHLLRLYAVEGAVLTVVAVIVAPFLAMTGVAMAGKLPYFHEITGGDTLPVEMHWMPFLVAAGAGLLVLAIFVLPAAFAARTGLVIHKLRSSRPPSVPFFQRYYLDVVVLGLAGLVFWELHQRGELVSGGLFDDVQVNEAMLLAPVLLMTGVALGFMRLFPIFVRFISGESATLLHLLAAATLLALGSAIVAQDLENGEEIGWLIPVILVAALGGAYWAAQRARRLWPRTAGLVLQGVLVALVLSAEPLERGEPSFVPTIGMMVLVPAQIVFLLLRSFERIAPVWVSVGLWRMARNPLQYGWLVLLLVMVTGLGVLATTVGGTLDKSYEQRILYDVASDVRVSGISRVRFPGSDALKETYLSIPGVTAVSLGFRTGGVVGTTAAGLGFELLAVESQDFPYISWYRDDFSARPLNVLMGSLRSEGQTDRVEIPGGATTIGLWAKPEEVYPNVFLWVVMQDSRGVIDTVTLGAVGEPEWHLMRAEIPPHLQSPVELISIQIFEPGFGPVGTPGQILIDDIHTTGRSGAVEQVIDGFEDGVAWKTLATSMLSTDSIRASGEDPLRGERSGKFVFGKDTDRGIRGFYRNRSGGPLPVVASVSFMQARGLHEGDSLIVSVMGRLVPVVVSDTVRYFPTLDPNRAGFLLADLDGLLTHLNLLSPAFNLPPNELFINQAPGAGEAVRQATQILARSTADVHEKDLLLAAVRLDPLITAGWKAMVVLSMGIIIFTAGLGYATYLLSFADRNRTEMGFLQSLGLSRGQMIGLLSLEHLAIVVVGVGLGTWFGFQMSSLIVSSVAVTETGSRVVPPFILTTDWGFMAPVYVLLAAIFVGALYWLLRSVLRLDLHLISRVEGG